MKKSYIMKNINRRLSNRFDGSAESINVNFSDKNIAQGIQNHMTIIVQNLNSVYPLPFALIPANFDTLRISATTTEDSGIYTTAITKAYNDVTEMRNAGFTVDGVACDGGLNNGAKTGEDEVSYACSSADPSRSIKKFLDYIKLNPVRLASMEVVSSDNNSFDTNMMLTYVNPFFKNAEQNVDLSVFFSLYQQASDRIRMDFNGQVELNDLSLFTATIQPSTTMKFIMRFM